jgi:hypothetical protein
LFRFLTVVNSWLFLWRGPSFIRVWGNVLLASFGCNRAVGGGSAVTTRGAGVALLIVLGPAAWFSVFRERGVQG